MDIKTELETRFATSPAAPFLFVGSGLSRRYVNLENWAGLLAKFCKQIGIDSSYLFSQVNNDLPQAATNLASEFHKKWWKQKAFAVSRAKFKSAATQLDSPLKIEIAEFIKAKAIDEDDAAMVAEIELFKAANIDGIITTNWDLLLERLFPDYTVYRGQENLLFGANQGIAEIYKIHGCCTVPQSMVLTSDDYKGFALRNTFLAAKLVTIFVEHPIVFFGYSLSDPNVTEILTSISTCLGPDNLGKLQNRLIVVQWDRHNSGEVQSAIHNYNGHLLPVTVIKTDSFVPVLEALKSVRRKFPAKLLRKLKQQVYELVATNDPNGQLFVADLDSENETSQIDIVYGVGAAARMGGVGYSRISREQVISDVLFDKATFNPDMLIRHTLSDLLAQTKYTPIFRYLRQAGYLGLNAKAVSDLPKRVQTAMNTNRSDFDGTSSYKHKKAEIQSKNCGIKGLTATYDVEHCALYIPLLAHIEVDIVELEEFLRKNYQALQTVSTSLNKLISLYDFLKYGPNGADRE